MREPKRIAGTNGMVDYVAARVEQVLAAMRERGFDPVIFEGLRTAKRQLWLYGVGRTHSKRRRPVTWTRTSRHMTGKAADIISKSRGWDWPEFYDALEQEARKVGLRVLTVERCHVEWR